MVVTTLVALASHGSICTRASTSTPTPVALRAARGRPLAVVLARRGRAPHRRHGRARPLHEVPASSSSSSFLRPGSATARLLMKKLVALVGDEVGKFVVASPLAEPEETLARPVVKRGKGEGQKRRRRVRSAPVAQGSGRVSTHPLVKKKSAHHHQPLFWRQDNKKREVTKKTAAARTPVHEFQSSSPAEFPRGLSRFFRQANSQAGVNRQPIAASHPFGQNRTIQIGTDNGSSTQKPLHRTE